MEALHTDKVRKDLGPPPSIIPAIRQPISGRQYSCHVSDTGVQFCDESNENTPYEADLNGCLPLLTPKLTKAGKVAVHQPNIPKKSVKWWKAQCGFRGLAVGGNLRDLQGRIRAHGNKGLSNSIKGTRENMEKDYVAKNIDAIEKIWIQADNNEKAKVWPKMLLYESFITHSRSSKEALVVEVDDWGNKIEEASRQMQIICEMRKMPDHQTGQRLVVVGLDEQVVRSKFAEINRDAQRSILRARQEREEREKEFQDDFERRFSSAKSKGRALKGKWNVSGIWKISCPYIEEQWGARDDRCSLEIRATRPTESGLAQVYGLFDFISVTGIMRFVNPNTRADTQDKVNKGRSSQEHDLTSDEDEHEFNSDIDSRTHAQFLLSNASMPSSNSREFDFRWRGEETGENEIQLYSDKELCSMTFESPDALAGVFISDLTGKIDFKGFRDGFDDETERGGPQKRGDTVYSLDPSYEWASRSEAAYERARIGRWG